MITYLAAPYSVINPESALQETVIKRKRFRDVTRAAGLLMTQYGELVFSPITHCHPIAIEHGLPGDFDYWRKYNEEFIKCASRLIVLTLDGWEESAGVTTEIALAHQFNLPTIYLELRDNGLFPSTDESVKHLIQW